MKWENIKDSDFPVLYVDTGKFDREIEIWCTGKKFTVRLYRNTSLITDEDPKSYKTLSLAKMAAEKWLKKEIRDVRKDLDRVMECLNEK